MRLVDDEQCSRDPRRLQDDAQGDEVADDLVGLAHGESPLHMQHRVADPPGVGVTLAKTAG
jgi:hypothetical protein